MNAKKLKRFLINAFTTQRSKRKRFKRLLAQFLFAAGPHGTFDLLPEVEETRRRQTLLGLLEEMEAEGEVEFKRCGDGKQAREAWVLTPNGEKRYGLHS